jgi:hypothetical protein
MQGAKKLCEIGLLAMPCSHYSFAIVRPMPVTMVLALLSACSTEGPPNSCPREGDEALEQCFSAHAEESFRSFVEECLPSVEPSRFEGTWANDFEFDEFHQGRKLAADDAWRFTDSTTKLEVGGTALESFTTDRNASVLYVEFTGRKVPCAIFGPDYDVIVVDRVISRDIIENRLSNWYR